MSDGSIGRDPDYVPETAPPQTVRERALAQPGPSNSVWHNATACAYRWATVKDKETAREETQEVKDDENDSLMVQVAPSARWTIIDLKAVFDTLACAAARSCNVTLLSRFNHDRS